MELFVAGLVLGVLLTLCASGRGDARMSHGHQPPARPIDPATLIRPSGSGAKPPRSTPRIEPTTGGYGVRPSVPAKPYPPPPTPRA